MNQSGIQKIQQKRCACRADLTFSQTNSHYKRFKFDLILSKSVSFQFQEELKDNILELLVFKRCIKETLIYDMASRATVFCQF